MIRQKYHIGDFTQWKQHDAYQQALSRLLRDLREGGGVNLEVFVNLTPMLDAQYGYHLRLIVNVVDDSVTTDSDRV